MVLVQRWRRRAREPNEVGERSEMEQHGSERTVHLFELRFLGAQFFRFG